jgi:peptide/nickel transport system substrate-binding protein
VHRWPPIRAAIRFGLALIAAASAVAALPAHAETTMRWVTSSPPSGLDPHASDNTPTSAVLNEVFDRLVYEDWQRSFQPALAQSWSLEAPTVWRFELRPGVKFHSGASLTAEDVVFSVRRAQTETSSIRNTVVNIADVRAADAHAVLITTATPDLILPFRMSDVPIISRRWAEQHGQLVPTPSEPVALADAAWGDAGTGPYRIESFAPGVRTVLVKDPGWWGAGVYPAAADRIEQTTVPSPEDAAARMAEGAADFANFIALSPAALGRLEATPGIRLKRAETAQTVFLGFDLASPELRTSSVKGRNPFQDRRVREAIYRAIEFPALKSARGGLAAPAGMILGRTANGWNQELDRPLDYDPDRARQLLTEAGYHDGFEVTLDAATIGGEVNAPIQAMLAKIGIAVALRVAPVGEVDRLIAERRTDFVRWGWTEADDSAWIFRAIYRSGATYTTRRRQRRAGRAHRWGRFRDRHLRPERADRADLAPCARRHTLRAALPKRPGLGDARPARHADRPLPTTPVPLCPHHGVTRMHVSRHHLAAALAVFACAALVAPARSLAENVVRWTSAAGATSWEPTNFDTPSMTSREQVYEALTLTDADLRLRPGLATSWTLAGRNTWRFKLRAGVRFHDGSPLTADDVVFSLNRSGTEPAEVAYFAASMVTVAVDDETIEITTKQPELRLPVQVKNLAVMSKAWAQRHGADLPAARNDASAFTRTLPMARARSGLRASSRAGKPCS